MHTRIYNIWALHVNGIIELAVMTCEKHGTCTLYVYSDFEKLHNY